MNRPIAKVLTIAGSDSGGGAGIEADLKTFTALGVYGMAAVTSITAQDSNGVYDIHDIPFDTVAKQISVVAVDFDVDVAKTGMLSNKSIIHAVVGSIRENLIETLIVDPVMLATSGDTLLAEDAQETLIEELLPLAFIVTPNIPEAEAMANMYIKSEQDLWIAAKKIHSIGPQYVLIKGGHLDTDKATDFLFDGEDRQTFSSPMIDTKNTHGTGCTYSAAIAAFIAKGLPVTEAVQQAKDYLTGAIQNSFDIGSGHGPLNHYWNI